MTEDYCVTCRSKRTISDPLPVTMKNGLPATCGACLFCGTAIFLIGSPSGISGPENRRPGLKPVLPWEEGAMPNRVSGLCVLIVEGLVVAGVIWALVWLFKLGPAWDEKMPWLLAGFPVLIVSVVVVPFILAALCRVFPSLEAKLGDNATGYAMAGIAALIAILGVLIIIGETMNSDGDYRDNGPVESGCNYRVC